MKSLGKILELLQEIRDKKQWGSLTIVFKEGEFKTLSLEQTTKL